MFNLLLVILFILLVVFGNTEGFTTCHDLLFTPENVMKYTCDKLNKEKLDLDLYNSQNESNGEPYVLKYEEKPHANCIDNVKDLNINNDSNNLKYNKDLSNPLSASDIYYNENRPYPNSLPFVYKF